MSHNRYFSSFCSHLSYPIFYQSCVKIRKTFTYRKVASSRLHRGAFCQFPFRWIYYCHSSKSTGTETGKTHICAVGCLVGLRSNFSLNNYFENKIPFFTQFLAKFLSELFNFFYNLQK